MRFCLNPLTRNVSRATYLATKAHSGLYFSSIPLRNITAPQHRFNSAMSVLVDNPEEPQAQELATEDEILHQPSTTGSPVAEIGTPGSGHDGDLAYTTDLGNGGLLPGLDEPVADSPPPPTPPSGRRKKGETLPVELWLHKKVRKQQPSRTLMDHLRPVYKPEYYFEDGLRRVVPYHYTYNTFCKERWRGKTLIDIFLEEFRDRPEEYYVCPFLPAYTLKEEEGNANLW